MKRILFGIFAHPDDEAFGPSATLMKEVQEGTELHLICVTYGQNGMNPDKHQDLGAVRLQEWRAAGKMMGAQMHPLGYMDGTLCNQMYHQIAGKIDTIVRQAAAEHPEAELCFVTFDPNGLTGHLDHIAVSNITSYIFYKLKADPPAGCHVAELAYYCLPRAQFPEPSTSYVFMPAGRPAEFINRHVNVSAQREAKYKLMRLHHSQREDAAAAMKLGDVYHNTDSFHVVT